MSKRAKRYNNPIRIPEDKIHIKTRRKSRKSSSTRRKRSLRRRRRRRHKRRRRRHTRRCARATQIIIQLLSSPVQTTNQNNLLQALQFSPAASQALKRGNIKEAFTLAVISRTFMNA